MFLADTQWNATRIAEAAAAGVKYEIVGKPILTIQEAITAGSFFDPPGASVLQVGDAKCNKLLIITLQWTLRFTTSSHSCHC